ncbi:unnamed protein product [Linum trigynum]|uniref:PWWP domain-containing protein n=1 Tax=Linum trigynum TaxID=586398 RepID=A0AAV2F1J7_9ROSI
MKVTRKTVAESPSSLAGEESQDPHGKGSTITRMENGIRACEKGGFISEGLDGGGVSAVNNNSSGKIVSLFDGNRDSLEDSEMNGISSLLEMQQSGRYPGLDSVLEVIDKNERKEFGNGGDDSKKQGEVSLMGGRETEGKYEGKEETEVEGSLEEEDEMEELDYDVGDFVWGKIKSHPWWPGRIYDPLDASEQAKKVKHGQDRILVAYFGDGTFAWCNPSQLKPFHENFVEMANQSTSKNFVNAVEKALEEVGRSIDLSLTCSCVPRDNLFGFGRSLAANAGVRDGLLVPEGGDFSDNTLFKPENVFHSIKYMSKGVRFGNALELAIVKSSLSAFYRGKCGSKLQAFSEPTEIPGLEDDSPKWMLGDPNNQKDTLAEGIFPGPVEEDWVSSSLGQDSQNSLQTPQVFPERLAPRRRKQKSIAEIISGSPNTETEAEASGSKTVSGRKKRTSKSEVAGEEVIENPEPSGSKKRKVRSSPKVTEVAKTEASLGDISASSLHKSKASNEIASSGQQKSKNIEVPYGSRRSKRGKEANVEAPSESVPGLRKRKGREVPGSPVIAADHDTLAINVKNPVSRRRKKQEDNSVVNDDSLGKTEEATEKKMAGGSTIENDGNKGYQTSENVALSRQRKKSRYLSPPYTNITIGQRPKMKASGESQLAEDKTEAAGHHSNDVKSQEELSKEQAVVDGKPDDLIPETTKGQTRTIEARTAASEMLCHIRSVALNPLHVEESKHLDQVLGFVSELRSSGHNEEGSNNEQNIKPKRGRKKRKLQEGSESDPTSPNDLKSHQNKEFQKTDKPVAATLHVTFGPGSSLPSKDDLLRIYGPFGALNKDETDMLYNNRCARIAFSSKSDAEEALSHSQRSSPFGTSHVNFRLRYPPSTPKVSVHSELHHVIEKLETVDSMLKSSSSEMSANLKSRVGGEIRGVIEKLNTMVRPPGVSS